MNKNETAKELLLKADELISKAKELLALTVDDESDCDTTDDILAAWKKHISTVDAYGLMDDDEVSSIVNGPYPQYVDDFNPYGTYPTEKYALMAQKMKIFNDKLLAFKWCYDRDYVPNWRDVSETKYIVNFDNTDRLYAVDEHTTWSLPAVWFSSEEIAQKCADWLNSLEEKES